MNNDKRLNLDLIIKSMQKVANDKTLSKARKDSQIASYKSSINLIISEAGKNLKTDVDSNTSFVDIYRIKKSKNLEGREPNLEDQSNKDTFWSICEYGVLQSITCYEDPVTKKPKIISGDHRLYFSECIQELDTFEGIEITEEMKKRSEKIPVRFIDAPETTLDTLAIQFTENELRRNNSVVSNAYAVGEWLKGGWTPKQIEDKTKKLKRSAISEYKLIYEFFQKEELKAESELLKQIIIKGFTEEKIEEIKKVRNAGNNQHLSHTLGKRPVYELASIAINKGLNEFYALLLVKCSENISGAEKERFLSFSKNGEVKKKEKKFLKKDNVDLWKNVKTILYPIREIKDQTEAKIVALEAMKLLNEYISKLK